jgi:hypothetical protein
MRSIISAVALNILSGNFLPAMVRVDTNHSDRTHNFK